MAGSDASVVCRRVFQCSISFTTVPSRSLRMFLPSMYLCPHSFSFSLQFCYRSPLSFVFSANCSLATKIITAISFPLAALFSTPVLGVCFSYDALGIYLGQRNYNVRPLYLLSPRPRVVRRVSLVLTSVSPLVSPGRRRLLGQPHPRHSEYHSRCCCS